MIAISNLNEFLNYQTEMKVTSIENGSYIIEGTYNLSSSYNEIYLQKYYNIRIIIHEVYPKKLPQVINIDGTIPKEFGHFYVDGSLCLGSPMELYLSAIENNISDYLIKYIDSYLYAATYFIKYNSQFPYGERSHGTMGIIEFWKEYLNTDDYKVIHNVMDYISKDNYRGHNLCSCGSGERVRNCHGNKILPIIKNSLIEVVKEELNLFDKEVKKTIECQKATSRRKL